MKLFVRVLDGCGEREHRLQSTPFNNYVYGNAAISPYRITYIDKSSTKYHNRKQYQLYLPLHTTLSISNRDTF